MLEQLMWTDYILLLIIFVSTLISIRKGFFEELFSIISIGTAVFVSFRFGKNLVSLLDTTIGENTISPSVVMMIAFFSTYMVLSKFTKKILRYLRQYKIGVLNKLLALVFGFLRGILVATLLVALTLFAPFVKSDNWLHTPVTIALQPLSDNLMSHLPDKFRAMLKTQVKNLESSEFVNQTKKLFNALFDADLEIRDTNVASANKDSQQELNKTPEQIKVDKQQQLKEIQNTRLYREKIFGGNAITDLPRPDNLKSNPTDQNNLLFKKSVNQVKQPVSDKEALLIKQQEQKKTR